MRSLMMGCLAIWALGCSGQDGTQGAMGTMGDMGAQGSQGPAGGSGHNSLVKTTAELAGGNCTAGGTKIEVGVDINDNGALDTAEVNTSATRYVCNGVDGGSTSASVVTDTSLTGNGSAGSPLAVSYAGTGTSTSAAHADHDHDATYLKKGSVLACTGTDKISSIDSSTGNVTCTADTNAGGTVTSVGAGTGLTGGPITTTGSLAIDTSVVPRLSVANIFTATQTVAPASGTGLIVRGASGATIQEWRDSADVKRASVDQYGVFHGAVPTVFPYAASFAKASNYGSSVLIGDGIATCTFSSAATIDLRADYSGGANLGALNPGTYLAVNLAVHASTQLTGDTAYIVIGGAGATVSTQALGFKIVDNQLYGMSNATGTESTVLLGTVAAGTTYRLLAVVTSGTNLEFFVNGIHAGTLNAAVMSSVNEYYRLWFTSTNASDTTLTVSLAIGFAM